MLLLALLVQGLYVGTYSVLNWPILSVELSGGGGELVRGILVIATPNHTSGHTVFAGLLTLPNGSAYIASGVLDRGAIVIVNAIPLESQGALMGGVWANSDEVEPEVPPRTTLHPSLTETSPQQQSLTSSGSGLLLTLSVVSVVSTLFSMALSLVVPRPRGVDDCVEEEFMGIVRMLNITIPGTTHREVGEYLSRLLGDRGDVVKLVHLFEEATYGGRHVECREYRDLARVIRRRLHDRGIRRGWARLRTGSPGHLDSRDWG